MMASHWAWTNCNVTNCNVTNHDFLEQLEFGNDNLPTVCFKIITI